MRIHQLREYRKAIAYKSEEPWTDMEVRRTEKDIKKYETIASQLGLLDSAKNFADNDIGDQAMRLIHQDSTSAPRKNKNGDLIRSVLAENAAGLL
jgi:hypothetical protein